MKFAKTFKTWLPLAALVIASSCIPQSRLEYLQGNSKSTVAFPLKASEREVIKPGDELYIRVSSFDEVQFNFFSSQADNRQMNFSNDISVSLISYNVNDSGMVNFPLLGYLPVAGLTIEEATEIFKARLSEYTNQPTVLIKIVNKKISVIGEVAHPGQYTYTQDKLMIFEALSLAGDITVYGSKKKVYILRESENSVLKIPVDLTRDNLLAAEELHIKQNDVIYVPPLQSRTWSIESIPFHLILSGITTFILILNYIN